MNPCPAPNGSNLLDHQREPFIAVLKQLEANKFRKASIDPILPFLVAKLAGCCESDEGFIAMSTELDQWVRWHRIPAYWMTYIFQLVTQQRGTVYHLLACRLYADAQTHFADDLAVVSVETAYTGYVNNLSHFGSAYETVRRALESRLRLYHRYYNQWAQPFKYIECNPLADHLYTEISRQWLENDLSETFPEFHIRDQDALRAVIRHCNGPEHDYHEIIARRFLGLQLAAKGDYEASAFEYAAALEKANAIHLDTEIGHLYLHHGSALRALGKMEDARRNFERAYVFEHQEPFYAHTMYWQALSARELGDTILRCAGQYAAGNAEGKVVEFDNAEALQPARKAYKTGRLFLDGHLIEQCPFPVGRAAKQQIFRSFSEHAIQVACNLTDTNEMLAEVEASGPREATEIITEIAAVRQAVAVDLADFRSNRALYQKTLNTLPVGFEDYLASVPRIAAAKRAYLQQSFALDKKLTVSQVSERIVEQLLELRLPDTVFLMFFVGAESSIAVLMDMASGTAAPFRADFGEAHLRQAHREYAQLANQKSTRHSAMDRLLERYGELLEPVMAQFVGFLPGKHLKIFPRLYMNSVPLHALLINRTRLIEQCRAISYAPTMGMFLSSHQSESGLRTDRSLRVIKGHGIPWYEFIMPKVREDFDNKMLEHDRITWPDLTDQLTRHRARDILFACHGHYDPENLDHSYLQLSEDNNDGRVNFSQIFQTLDLRHCRNVIMGACESGLIHSGIGSEYIGLASAMLSSGTQYVTGALWKIPQAATAVLIQQYLALTSHTDANPCDALCQAQRELMSMSRDDFQEWVVDHVPTGPKLDQLENDIKNLPDLPFAAPYHWAGLQIVGDV